MKQPRLALILPAIQVVIAAALLIIDHRQQPTAYYDPFSVGSAIKVCLAINLPALLLWGWLVDVVFRAGLIHYIRPILGSPSLFAVIVLLWFVVGLEAGSHIQRRAGWYRPIVNCVGLSLGIALVYLAYGAWRQEAILAVGSAAWGVALVTVYGMKLAMPMTRR